MARQRRTPKTATPDWQPVSELPTIAGLIDSAVADLDQHHALLCQVRQAPSLGGDPVIERSLRVHTAKFEHAALFEEQFA